MAAASVLVAVVAAGRRRRPTTAAAAAAVAQAGGGALIVAAALGSRLLLANTGSPSASDGALDGQTIEFEWCTASRGGVRACVDELDGQHATSRAAGAAAGRTALSVMWLTDAKALPAETQCSELRLLQQSMPWLLAGLDRSDLTWPANASCTQPSAAATAATPTLG